MLLETVLGTYFAWTILKEIPSLQVIFGGIHYVDMHLFFPNPFSKSIELSRKGWNFTIFLRDKKLLFLHQ